MEKTVYRIEGQSELDPRDYGDLPEGFTVVEEMVDDPAKALVPCIGSNGRQFGVEVSNLFGERQVCLRFHHEMGDRISIDSARKVRDALNVILGEETPFEAGVRVLVDGDGDLWYETKPGLFTAAPSAEAAVRDSDNGLMVATNFTVDRIREKYGIKVMPA